MKHILSVLFVAVGLICTTGVTFADIVPAQTASDNVTAIQAAIDAAAVADPVGTVTLGEGLFEIDSQLMVTGGVTLVGQGWDKTILKQTMARVVDTNTLSLATRVVWIDNGATVSRLAITGGSANMAGGWSWGGGAFVADGTISWCCITNNTSGVDGSSNNYGGGVGFGDGKGQIDHSIVADNVVRGLQTSYGAGIAIRHPTGNVTIDTCLISGNRVFNKQRGKNKDGEDQPLGGGAGIVVEIVFGSQNYNMTVRNSTIVGNSAECAADVSLGGAVYTREDTGKKFSMLNCIIADNTTAGTNTTVELSYAGGVDYCLFDIEADKVGEHSRFGDPAFVGAEDDDYRLELTSPAVGTGIAYEGIGKDLNNAEFSNTPSMGCYEYAELAARPSFEIASGTTFYPTTNVTLSCATDGATIYYTTDGSRPTDASTLYTGPIAISATTTIRARAYASTVGPSGIATATYTFKRPTPPLSDFRKYVEVTLSTDLASSEITTGVPALVKLSESTIIGFDYDDFSLANGGDMMFVDENGNPVPHEIDTWDTDGESLVWVRLPSTATNTKVFMYYGNGAISSEEAADVWTDYVGVWHFEEATAVAAANSYGTYANSTAIAGIDGNVAEYTITGEAGRFGKSFRVNDSQGRAAGNFNYGGVWVNDSGSNSPIDGGQNFTISGWFKHGEFNYNYDHIFYKRQKSANNSTTSFNNAFAIECQADNAANPNPKARGSSGNGKDIKLTNDLQGAWGYLTFVYDGAEFYLYENGEYLGWGEIAACIDNDSPLVFGNNCDVAAGLVGDAAWNGWIDEVRYSKGSKSAEWIAAEFAAMNTSATDIFTYGAAQVVGILPVDGDPVATRQTIQDAIDAAAPTHGTVTLASGLFEIDAQLNVTSGVTLVGQGWENTVIKQTTVPAASGYVARCAMLDDGAKLNGIALTGGRSKKEYEGGAGVWVKNGTISWCCITNNVGDNHYTHGCGVSFSGGQGAIDHSIVSDNSSTHHNIYGAGIGALDPSGPITIDTCLVVGNVVPGSSNAGGAGAGIGIKAATLDCTICNCTVVGNSGNTYTGGIRLEATGGNGNAVILNTIAVGNTLNGNASNYAVNTDKISLTGSGNCFFGIESETNSIPNSLFGDPLFFDAANGDYRLRENSRAANAGVSYSGIGVDLDDVTFAAAPSIGCYEYDPNALPPAGEWDIPGGGSGGGGIKGLDDGHGGKCVAFTAIERVGSDVAVEFQAAEIGASVGASFGLICKDNLADTETFTLNAQLTAVDTTNVLGTLKTQTDKTQLFVVGIGPAQ